MWVLHWSYTGSGKCSSTVSPRLPAICSGAQLQTRVGAPHPTQRSPGLTGRQGYPRSPGRAVPSNSESRGPHASTHAAGAPAWALIRENGRTWYATKRESASYPPPDGELKQRGGQATPAGAREHLPQAPELAGSSAQPELPRRRTARRRGRSRREGGRRRAGIRAPGCRTREGVPSLEN